ncbi:MAG: DUF4919 domain-containing protein [Bacteroidales bacterium]|nr:DUF4919 domain-containing protein [Bacteroidales bacterium]
MKYLEMLKHAIAKPDEADFAKLRELYAEWESYFPYSRDEEHGVGLNKALDACDWKTALEDVNFLIRENYLDIEAHSAAEIIYRALGEMEKSGFHGKFSRGMINSILKSGDGLDFKSAYIVVDVREEYVVMKYLGVEPLTQDLVMDENNHQYDVFEVKNLMNGQKSRIHFNVDRPKSWLDQNYMKL